MFWIWITLFYKSQCFLILSIAPHGFFCLTIKKVLIRLKCDHVTLILKNVNKCQPFWIWWCRKLLAWHMWTLMNLCNFHLYKLYSSSVSHTVGINSQLSSLFPLFPSWVVKYISRDMGSISLPSSLCLCTYFPEFL